MPEALREFLELHYERPVTSEQFVSYLYGLLAQPAFTRRYRDELSHRELRVPITRDAALFEELGVRGDHLLSLHTRGEWRATEDRALQGVPKGRADYRKPILVEPDSGCPESFAYDRESGVLRIGHGELHSVDASVYDFEVSGLKVVPSWLRYRMRDGAGRRTSPLDRIGPRRWTYEMTRELLELLWMLEATVAGYPEQERLLDLVVQGKCFDASELPAVPPEARKPPRQPRSGAVQGRIVH